jgi:hypothetical protein
MSVIDSADLIFSWPSGTGTTGGNRLLKRTQSFKPADAATREAVMAVGSQRPVGSMRKPGAQTITLEEKPDTVEEVPWETLQASGALCKLIIQYKGGSLRGPRWQYSVQVASVNQPEGDEGGSYSRTIELLVIGEGKRLS